MSATLDFKVTTTENYLQVRNLVLLLLFDLQTCVLLLLAQYDMICMSSCYILKFQRPPNRSNLII